MIGWLAALIFHLAHIPGRAQPPMTRRRAHLRRLAPFGVVLAGLLLGAWLLGTERADGAADVRLDCRPADRPRLRCEARGLWALGDEPQWRVYCPGEAVGGTVCDAEHGVVSWPTVPDGPGWVWVAMTWPRGRFAFEARWTSARAEFRGDHKQ